MQYVQIRPLLQFHAGDKRLQVQNFAARLICSNLFVSRYTDSPIEQKRKHETVGLCYQIFTGTAPLYLVERG